MNTHQNLVDWANNWPNCGHVVPVIAKLQGQEWEGIQYKKYPIVNGNSHYPIIYVPEPGTFYYFLGSLPKVYRKCPLVCFVLPEHEHEYFVGVYHQGNIDSYIRPFNQCGINWSLEPWLSDEPIDKYAKHEYPRFEIELSCTLENVSAT